MEQLKKLIMCKNLCPAGRQGLLCFTISALVFAISFFSSSLLGFTSELWGLNLWGPGLYFCLFNFILRYCYKGFIYDVSVRSTFLGCVFATGLYMASFDEMGWSIFGVYVMILSSFHFSEFLGVAYSNPSTLSVDSFILNHSLQYALAATASWLEFFVEYYFIPSLKTYTWISAIGVLLCVSGELLRKVAMFTAKTNFNHTVQFVKHPDHKLVTSGVYSVFRHPSYVGWFYWSIGTQITLLNPICVIIYTGASWMFFRERVYTEEVTLLTFFGEEYEDYQKRVPIGIPYLRGFDAKEYAKSVNADWKH